MSNGTVCRATFSVLAALSAYGVGPARAQVTEAGTLASAGGAVEIRHGDAKQWEPALPGVVVLPADHLRTGGSVARAVLADDSVVDLGVGTEVTLERFAFEPEGGKHDVLLRLVKGKLRVFLSGGALLPAVRYEVETPTAVVTSHATEFIVVYDEENRYTDVAGGEGNLEVQGKVGVLGSPIKVGSLQWTRIEHGQFPSAPAAADADVLAGYRDGLEVVGTGGRDGLDVGHPALAGRKLRPEDVPRTIVSAAAKPPSYLEPGAAQIDRLADQLSPDVRVHTQPIPEYLVGRPGEPRTGNVQVDF